MLRKYFLFSILLLTCVNPAWAKIRILTFHYNKAEFIDLQYRSLKKFLKDDFELIVFNDARTLANEEAIHIQCERYHIPCVRYEQKWHELEPFNIQVLEWLKDPLLIHSHLSFASISNESISMQPSIRHCHVIQYALENYGYAHNDIIVIMDGDVFPIRPLSIKSLMHNQDIIGIQKIVSAENIDYLWVPFIAVNMPKISDKKDLKFHVDVIGHYLHDTGAHTYHYLKNHPDLKVKKYAGHSSTSFYQLSPTEMNRHGFNDQEIEFTKNLPWPLCVEFHIEHRFLHFGAISFYQEGAEIKSTHVKNFMEKIIAK